jgi:hypothetical protein
MAAMNRVVYHTEAPAEEYEEYDEKPKRAPPKNITKAEKHKRKMMKASEGVKGLMALNPTKAQVAEFLARRIDELEAEDDLI